MPSVGSISFDLSSGPLHGLQEKCEHVEQPGRDGSLYRLRGSEAPESELTGTKFSTTLENAWTHIDNCEALPGSVVTITDDQGETHTNYLIVAVAIVQPPKVTIVHSASLSGSYWRTVMRLTARKLY